MKALQGFYASALRTKMYVDGFYAGLLRVLALAFVYNCVMFNVDGSVLHIGKVRGINQIPSIVSDAHAEEHVNVDTRCDRFLSNFIAWQKCRKQNDK